MTSVVEEELAAIKKAERRVPQLLLFSSLIQDSEGGRQEQQLEDTETRKLSCIYTDGSSLGNGRQGAVAGCGVYFGVSPPPPLKNLSVPLPGALQTNVRAEWFACILAMETVERHPDLFQKDLLLYTDHLAILKSLQGTATEPAWVKGWERRDWTSSSGSEVKNQDLIRRAQSLLQSLQRSHNLRLVWVKGHSVCEGNQEADKLAVAASQTVRQEQNKKTG